MPAKPYIRGYLELRVRRQITGYLRHAVLDHLKRDDHVGRRVELRGDFRRASDAPRSDLSYARHRHDDLLDRPAYDERHRLRRQRPGVRNDDDARELQGRIDAARQCEPGDRAADDEGHGQKTDRA